MACTDLADSKQVLEASGLFYGNGLPQPATRNRPHTEDVSEDLLMGLDSIWEDVNDRLTISRMVSNSVINGVVNAVSQEAAELVANREAEVVVLKENLKELLWEQQVQGEIEKILIGNVLQSLSEEFETILRDQNVYLRGDRTASCMHKFEELSGLRKHLDAIQKSLSSLEVAQLSSHGSLETDHLHLKSSYHVSPTSGLADEFNISLPENRESSHLTHMNIDELYHFFRTHLTKMKRDHESAIQAMTEDFFTLKRELLKERGSCFPFKKEKDFDILRKKIPVVIVELDEILLDNKEVSEICSISRDKLESLISENQRLRNLVATESDNIAHLTSQLSDASQKLSQHSLIEAKLNEVIEDNHVEASVSEEVCKSYIMELLLQIACDVEESNTKSAVAQEFIEIIYNDAAQNIAAALTSDFGDDSNFESVVLLGISGIVFEEVLKGVGMELKSFNMKCLQESKLVELLKLNTLEMERSLAKEAKERSSLEHEVAILEASVEDKIKLIAEITHTLEKERETLKQTKMELVDCRVRHEAEILEGTRELDGVKVELEECLEKTALYEEEIARWKEKLEAVEKECRQLVMREKYHLHLAGAKDTEQRKQMESTIHITRGLLEAFAKFELRVVEKTKWNNLRLENSNGQLKFLKQKANMLRRTGLLCKQRLEKRVSDLRKAEAEVDLLGDEVDTLLNLLEKIYMALDHYSPILRHYPGIMEILELVRRELSGESLKSI